MPLPSILRYTKTATDDNAFTVSTIDQWLQFADIFCYDEDGYFGDINGQDIQILAGDSYSILYPVNLKDLFFKNVTAGSNCRIVIIATPYNSKVRRVI